MNERAVCIPFKCRIAPDPIAARDWRSRAKSHQNGGLRAYTDAMPSHSTHPTPSRSKASLLLDGGGRPQLLENDPLHHRHERTMPFHIVVTTRILSHAKVVLVDQLPLQRVHRYAMRVPEVDQDRV